MIYWTSGLKPLIYTGVTHTMVLHMFYRIEVQPLLNFQLVVEFNHRVVKARGFGQPIKGTHASAPRITSPLSCCVWLRVGGDLFTTAQTWSYLFVKHTYYLWLTFTHIGCTENINGNIARTNTHQTHLQKVTCPCLRWLLGGQSRRLFVVDYCWFRHHWPIVTRQSPRLFVVDYCWFHHHQPLKTIPCFPCSSNKSWPP